jgi:hypothetical protein
MRLGTVHGGWGLEIPAETRSYADGAAPIQDSFTTAPRGRVPFRFTSVGDLATPNTQWSKSSLNAATTVNQVQQFNTPTTTSRASRRCGPTS